MFSAVVHPEALPMLEVWICNQNGKALNGEMVDSLPKHLFRKGILCRNKCWHVGSRVPVLFMRIREGVRYPNPGTLVDFTTKARKCDSRHFDVKSA